MMNVTGYYNVVTGGYSIDMGEYELVMIIEAARTAANAALLYGVADNDYKDLLQITRKLCGIVQAEQNRRNSVKINIK